VNLNKSLADELNQPTSFPTQSFPTAIRSNKKHPKNAIQPINPKNPEDGLENPGFSEPLEVDS